MSSDPSINSRVGIKEVATEAGVSIATVSRALRGLHHVNPEQDWLIIMPFMF